VAVWRWRWRWGWVWDDWEIGALVEISGRGKSEGENESFIVRFTEQSQGY
jgi:hypothetical protein